VKSNDDGAVDGDTAASLADRIASRPAGEWAVLLDTAGVPAEIVDEQFCRTLFDDPEARSASWWPRRTRERRTLRGPGLLVAVTPGGGTVQRGPCMCGEHTRGILLEHGYSDEEIDGLIAEGAVLDAPLQAQPL